MSQQQLAPLRQKQQVAPKVVPKMASASPSMRSVATRATCRGKSATPSVVNYDQDEDLSDAGDDVVRLECAVFVWEGL